MGWFFFLMLLIYTFRGFISLKYVGVVRVKAFACMASCMLYIKSVTNVILTVCIS